MIVGSAMLHFMNLFSFEETGLSKEIILDSLEFLIFKRLTGMIAYFSYIFHLDCFMSKASLYY
jgi:hypothetical protein